MIDRSREYWTLDRRWSGDTVFILGGGPSLQGFDCTRLQRSGWILAINSSFPIAPFSDALYFNDHFWYVGKWSDGTPRRKTLERSSALILTTSRQVKRLSPDRVKLIRTGTGSTIKQGRSSGQTGISVAAALGAARIVLLGFDMRRVNGRSHHHNEYGSVDDKLYSRTFIPAFSGWNAMFKKSGVEVLNATPESALKEFKMINIEEVL